MNRIWIAVGIMVAMAVLCVGEQKYIKQATSTISQLIDKAYDDPSAIDELIQYWDDRNDVLYALSSHNELDQIAIAINQLDKNSDQLHHDLDQAKSATTTYYENQRAIFSNIL